MEDFKRPDHPDFMDSSELRKMQFTGIRNNSLSQYREIWILGEKVADMSEQLIAVNPQAWDILYADVFGCKSVETLPNKGN